MALKRLISIATTPVKAAKALGAAAARTTSGKSEATSLAKAQPAAKADTLVSDRAKQQTALRAAREPKVLTPKGLARQTDNKFKMRKAL